MPITPQRNISAKAMLPIGTMLHDRAYRVEGYLSSGGFGNTYVASCSGTDERVAIKEFFLKGVCGRSADGQRVCVSNSDSIQDFDQQRAKFRKEAQRLRALNNDHIVKVHDWFDANDTAYYVMDYIDGENLKEHYERTHSLMTEKEVLNILRQVLTALQEVHRLKMYHLDIKPGNIMIDNDGIVQLIDFGSSKQFDTVTGDISISTITYTNGYAPSEQMEQNHRKLGPQTDFYALGATLYNLLTGNRPPMPNIILSDPYIDKHESLPMTGVGINMRNLVIWMMQQRRADRPDNVEQIVEYLDANFPQDDNDNIFTKGLGEHSDRYYYKEKEALDNQLPPGTILKGRYRIERLLIKTTYCSTYEATDIVSKETYSIREFFGTFSSRANDRITYLPRYYDEIEWLEHSLRYFKNSMLNAKAACNPHLIKVYDVFEQNGTAYGVMEQIKGMTLAHCLGHKYGGIDYLTDHDVSFCCNDKGKTYIDTIQMIWQLLDAMGAIDSDYVRNSLTPESVTINCGEFKFIGVGENINYGPPDKEMALVLTEWTGLGPLLYAVLTGKLPPILRPHLVDGTSDMSKVFPMLAVDPNMRKLVLWLMSTEKRSVDEIKAYLIDSRLTPQPIQTPNADGVAVVSDIDASLSDIDDSCVVVIDDTPSPASPPRQIQQSMSSVQGMVPNDGCLRKRKVPLIIIALALVVLAVLAALALLFL